MSLSAKQLGWTHEKILIEAAKYKSRTEFLAEMPLVFREAERENLLDEAFGILNQVKWTHELVTIRAHSYSNPRTFSKDCHGGYMYAQRNSMLPGLFPNMRNKWTVETITEESKKYASKKEMKTYSESAYNAAHRLGIIDDLFSNMLRKWDEQSAREEADKYKTKFEFQIGCQPAYFYARSNGLLETFNFTPGLSTFSLTKPAYLYVVDTLLTDSSPAIMFGITNRKNPKYRYLQPDLKLMTNRVAYHFETGRKAFNTERFLIEEFSDFRIAKGLSPFSEKTGTRGEIIYAEAGRQSVEDTLCQVEECGYELSW